MNLLLSQNQGGAVSLAVFLCIQNLALHIRTNGWEQKYKMDIPDPLSVPLNRKKKRRWLVVYFTSWSATHTENKATIFAIWSSRSLQTNCWTFVRMSENRLDRTSNLSVTRSHLLGISSTKRWRSGQKTEDFSVKKISNHRIHMSSLCNHSFFGLGGLPSLSESSSLTTSSSSSSLVFGSSVLEMFVSFLKGSYLQI